MKIKFKKIVLIMIENMFLSSILFFSLAMTIGFFLFLKYDLEETEVNLEKIPSFNQALYKNINGIREKEKSEFLKIEDKKYPTLFEMKKDFVIEEENNNFFEEEEKKDDNEEEREEEREEES